jgi:hypothetical protein
MSVSPSVTAPAAQRPAADPGWRRLAAAAAIAAPLAELASVVFGIEHTSDNDRQLDIIHAHTGSFTAMVLFEQLCYTLVAVTAVAIALRLASTRGGRIAGVGAVIAVVGAGASLDGFGGALPTLAKPQFRDTTLYFLDHLGPIYGVTQGLAILVQVGLLTVFVALWRSGHVAWPWLAVAAVGLVASAVIGSGRVENVIAMLVVTAGFVGIARFLASSAADH